MRNCLTKSLCLLCASAALFLPKSASADLIVNGGFEPTPSQGNPGYEELTGGGDTTINGWTTIPTGVEWFSPSVYGWNPSPNGGYQVDLANYTTTPGGIQQAIPTTPNQTYDVKFYFGTQVSDGRDGTAAITVTANSQPALPFSISTLSTTTVWTLETLSFVADAPTTTLTWKFTGDPFTNFAFIDGVSATAVPLPAASAAGLALLGSLAGFKLLRSRHAAL